MKWSNTCVSDYWGDEGWPVNPIYGLNIILVILNYHCLKQSPIYNVFLVKLII